MLRDQLFRLYEHMFWADRRALASLKGEEVGGPSAAVRLLAHVLAAERVWLSRLLEDADSAPPVWPDVSIEQLDSLAASNAAAYRAYLEGLREQDLVNEVTYRNTQGTAFTTAVVDILIHVAMHGSYHRGQLARLVRDGGGEPVNTDYITFVRE